MGSGLGSLKCFPEQGLQAAGAAAFKGGLASLPSWPPRREHGQGYSEAAPALPARAKSMITYLLERVISKYGGGGGEQVKLAD